MPRRKLTTEVVKHVTVEFTYNVLIEGVPDDGALTTQVLSGLNDIGLSDGEIVGVKTSTRKVPVEAQG